MRPRARKASAELIALGSVLLWHGRRRVGSEAGPKRAVSTLFETTTQLLLLLVKQRWRSASLR